jgi:tetratricopeptide (TPR) repeat protein
MERLLKWVMVVLLTLRADCSPVTSKPAHLSPYLPQRYQTRRARLLQRRGGLVPDHPDAVAATWSLAFEKVEQANPAAADLLRLCAFLAPNAIPEEIITEGAADLGPVLEPVASDAVDLDEAIATLGAYSLLRRNATEKSLSVHRLVQAVIRDQMDEQDRHQWAQRAVRVVNAVFPEVEHQTWPQCDRLLPHAQACMILIEQERLTIPEAASLLTIMGWYLGERGRYTEAELPLHIAMVIHEQQSKSEDLDTAFTANTLGWLYRNQGKYEQAEPLFQRALAISEQQVGPEHPNTATSLNNLALLYQNQGKYEQAEPLYLRALAIREQQLGPLHPDTAQSLNNLAALYSNQGKYEQAEPLYQRALAICEQQVGPQHPMTQTIRANYARLLQEMKCTTKRNSWKRVLDFFSR